LIKEDNKSFSYPEYFNAHSKKATLSLLDGLISDQNIVLLEKEKDLIRYSYQVAGTVGVMMCDALECHNEKAKLFAVDLGIAMQLTNIARDVLEDAKMGRRYLPSSWVNGVSPKEIVMASKSKNKKVINEISLGIEKLILIAERYYISGSSGFVYLPIKTRFAISIASSVYREIGEQLKRKNFNWYEGRQITTSATKFKVSIKKIILELLSIQKIETKHKSELHRFIKDML
jgi:phytoene synthase